MYNAKLKIEQVHYEMLRRYIGIIIAESKFTFNELKNGYLGSGLSEKRFRWDMYWAANKKFNQDTGEHFHDRLYLYINDTHIDSALKCIIKEFENEG